MAIIIKSHKDTIPVDATISMNQYSGKVLRKVKNTDYDYIIIDEAKDVVNKDIDILLNELFDVEHDGLKYGHYIVFYNLEQGYNSEKRNLNESKRVPTNKLIVEYANRVLSVEHDQKNLESYLKTLKDDNIPGLTMSIYNIVREVKKAIKNHAQNLAHCSGELFTTALLIHSDLNLKKDEDSVFDTISEMDSLLVPLSEKTTERKSKRLLAFVTIHKYKGLEDSNIILVLPYSKIKSPWG